MDYLSPVNPDMNMESVYHATNENKDNAWLDILKTILPIGASLASDAINKEDYSAFARQQGFNVPEGMRIDKTQLGELFGERQHMRSDARMREGGGETKNEKPIFELMPTMKPDPVNPSGPPMRVEVPVQYIRDAEGNYYYKELTPFGQTPQTSQTPQAQSAGDVARKQKGRFRNE